MDGWQTLQPLRHLAKRMGTARFAETQGSAFILMGGFSTTNAAKYYTTAEANPGKLQPSAPEHEITQCASLLKSARNPFADRIHVGRSTNNDIVIADASVSKSHAFFAETNGAWTLVDLASRNGTMAGRVVLEANVPFLLTSTCRVTFGSYVAYFVTAADFHAFLQSDKTVL